MPNISMKALLEAGVHFGHQTRRWNPKMSQFIYGEKNGIHIIDLQKTVGKIKEACDFLREVISEGRHVLFVGTKKQAQEAIEENAKRCKMFYVNYRWLGGMLTNFKTIRKSVARLKEIEKMETEIFSKLPREEIANLTKEKEKLNRVLGGVKEMNKLPSALIIIDSKKEATAVKEARKLGIPIVGVVDTNSDPDEIDYIIPSNDDAIKSISLLTSIIADAILEIGPLKTETGEEVIEEKTEETPGVFKGEFEELLIGEETGEEASKRKIKKKIEEKEV